ncbi:MAG: TrkA C-terminal domain-containing protein, partial [Muribaculaceae bacterium]|nr:TrkA C-terminal domain-containing protein [Muribaculaceae bacterium]
PIVVPVSVLTTFTTPYFIRMSPSVATFVENHLPAKLKFLINRYCEDNNESHSASAGKTVWMAIIRRYLWRIVLYAIILIAIILIATTIVLPWAEKLSPDFGKPVVMIATLLSMSPFLLAMSLPTSKKDERRLLAEKHSNYRAPLIIMSVFRILIVLAFVVYLFTIFYSIKIGILGGIIVMTLILGVFTRQLRERMRKIETKFMNNLNERELRQTGRNNNLVSNLHLAFMHVGYGCPFVGERLMDSPLRSTYGVSVVNIQRGNNTMTVPSGHTRLFPGDIVGVIGNDEQIQKLLPVIDKEQEEDFSQNIGEFKLRSTEVGPSSPLIGQTITTADIRKNYSAHIVAIQRNGEYINNILDTPFEAGDVLWVVADKAALKKLNNI